MEDILKNLIASLIFVGAGALLVQVVYPAVAKALDDNVDLAGAWVGQLSLSNAEYTYLLKLKRRMRQWTGDATITKHGQDKYSQEFNATASRRGDWVIVRLLGKGSDAASMATGLLLLEDAGRTMNGAWAYRTRSGKRSRH